MSRDPHRSPPDPAPAGRAHAASHAASEAGPRRSGALQGDDALLRTRLKVQHLAVLASLGRHRNAHAAAEELSLSQPAISKVVREVEDIFGLALFDRGRAGMHPNRVGEALIRRAVALLNQLEDTRHDMRAIVAGEIGHLRLGVVPFIMPSLISHTLQRLDAEQVRLAIEIREETTSVLIEQLRRKELDCVVARYAAAYETELEQRILCRQQFAVVVSRRHPVLAVGDAVTLADTVGYGWVVPPPHTAARALLGELFLRAALPPPSVRIETSSLEIIKAALSSNQLVSLLPRDIAEHYAEADRLAVLPIATDSQLAPLTLIRRRNDYVFPAVDRFCFALLEAARHLTA